MWVLPKEPVANAISSIPLPYDIFPALRQSTPSVSRLAQRLGFKVVYYSGGPMSYADFIAEILDEVMLINIMNLILYGIYFLLLRKLSLFRRAATFAVGAAILAVGLMYDGEYNIPTFIMRAVCFRATLNMWDIVILRSNEEVAEWSYMEFFSHIFFLPLERVAIAEREKVEGKKRNVRVQAITRMAWSLMHIAWLTVLVTFVPTLEMYEKLSPAKRSAYSLVMAFVVFHILAGGITFMIEATALLFGIEQAEAFKNPFTAVGMRAFWSRWNRLISTLLHRVIFGGHNTHKSVEARKKEKNKTHNYTLTAFKAFMTFCVSGLFHEYLIYNLVSNDMLGMNTLFFVVNGIACIASTLLSVSLPKLNQQTPNIFKQAFMYGFFVSVGYLFMVPYLDGGFFNEAQSLFNEVLYARTGNPTNSVIFIFGQ